MNKMQLQQGDVWLEKVQNLPSGGKIIERKGILAYGEVTGHKHQLEDTNIKIIEKEDRFYIKVDKNVQLRHEEHKPITIEPGIWEFGQVYRYDYFDHMVKPVVD